MKLEEFVDQFADQFDLRSHETVAPSTCFKDLTDWSSLTLIMVIALVQTECGKNLSAKEIDNCQTVEDLYTLAKS